ncbi:MAG: histidine phosphatase family protein [Lachnospiraceae bacterium]|nr:histidine phosphatase family protein [Lachnospiraceae bacterium]
MIGILRHGKTDWNVLHKIQGRTDIELNSEGIRSAQDVRKKILDCNFDVCYVSPLKRARQTAEIVTEGSDIDVIVDDRLTEISFGENEGCNGVYGKQDHPLRNFFFDPENYKASNGAESFDELLNRVEDFYNDVLIKLMDEKKNVLIVAHGALNAGLITFLLGNKKKDFWAYGQSNCGLFKYYPGDISRTLEENSSSFVKDMNEKNIAATIYKK